MRRVARVTSATAIDRLVHDPSRLSILTTLDRVRWADFASLCRELGLTRGNLSSHVSRLAQHGYIQIKKAFVGGIPHTQYRITQKGRSALRDYWAALETIRAGTPSKR
jgi:DNA-binding HxlR family transcriptional regulator